MAKPIPFPTVAVLTGPVNTVDFGYFDAVYLRTKLSGLPFQQLATLDIIYIFTYDIFIIQFYNVL